MRLLIKGAALIAIVVTAIIIVMFAFVAADTPPVDSSGRSTLDVTTEFLSSVIGFNMTKYTLTPPPTGWIELNITDNNIKTVSESVNIDLYGPSFDYLSTEGTKLETMSIFRYGYLTSLKIYSQDKYIYSTSPSTNILNQAKIILQRYQTFITEEYAKDNSFLIPMQNILSSLDDLSPRNLTVGNINFQVLQNGDRTSIKWIYTENDIIMTYKRVDMTFRDNVFESFGDTWSLYKVDGFSVISAEEARAIALETAQNMDFRIVNEYRNETVTLPDLSNSVYEMYFTMLPYRNETSHNPSKISRDPLTLYPYWQFYFYFKGGKIGGYSGIQVGIWGDTKEIIYCSGYGFHDWNFASTND